MINNFFSQRDLGGVDPIKLEMDLRRLNNKKTIVISPFSKKLRDKDTPHPKNYPHWKQLINLLEAKGHTVYQVGMEGEEQLATVMYKGLTSKELIENVKQADLFISVENFFPHFMNYNFRAQKTGIVIFAKSDPKIFGYEHNINLLKSEEYLRWDQFGPWEATEYIEEAFVSPKIIMEAVENFGKV